MVMDAAGTAAPSGSVIEPEMRLEVVCANASVHTAMAAHAKLRMYMKLPPNLQYQLIRNALGGMIAQKGYSEQQ